MEDWLDKVIYSIGVVTVLYFAVKVFLVCMRLEVKLFKVSRERYKKFLDEVGNGIKCFVKEIKGDKL